MILNQDQATLAVALHNVMAAANVGGMLTLRFPYDTHVCEMEHSVQVKKFLGPHRYRSERYATWLHFKEAYGIA